jgi:hypothetical protein
MPQIYRLLLDILQEEELNKHIANERLHDHETLLGSA